MRIKGIKIDEDVARILNEQDKDDTSKYRVYSNDIKDGWSILGTYDDEYSALQVYDAWKLRLLRGNGRYGVYTDVRMFKPGEKAIFSGWTSLYDYVSKAFDRLAAGYSHPSQVPDFLQTRDLLEKLTKHELKLAKQDFFEEDLQAALDRWFEEADDYTNESINEDYEEDDCEDVPEEMHKERYVTYFETQEGRQRYTIYHVYTDSTDDSYNELCDKRDNQLGMYNSYKELRDALKERAEKIAEQRGWTVKSIENLGEDDEYYRERNKWESIKEGFNIGDKVQLKRKNNKIGIVKSIFKGDKDKNGKDIKYLDVEFEDGTKEGRPTSDFKKVNESIKEDYEWHGPVAKVTFDNGDVIETAINGTDEEIKSYYMGKTFNLGKEEDDMHKAVKVEVIRESMKEGFNKGDNNFPEGSFAAWYGEDLSGQTYEGDLYCAHQNLMSLFGCPSVVIGDFDCSNNQLTSLEGAPKEVEGDFDCSRNQLTSLKGAPKEVGKSFDCSYNQLTSLEWSPEKVGGYFNCYDNYLTSLEGAPEKVGGYFSCSNTLLISLKGAPKEVGGDFYCNNNNLTSLEGSPKEVAGDFYCYDNRLKSLDGIGEVEGEIYS